jgi:hypothetical protein
VSEDVSGEESFVEAVISAGSKKLPEGKLAEKLAKGADAVKAVYRFVRYLTVNSIADAKCL